MSQEITRLITHRNQYPKLLAGLQKCSEQQRTSRLRTLCQTDLYFLLRYGLGRIDTEHDWIFQRCREVQNDPDDRLDLWAREHYKSTIITYALTIQDILNDPDITVGIFSHTRPIAKGFLRQIKREFEGNTFLRNLFSDILWDNPQAQAPKWSEDDGLIVKRKANPKEATIEAWGLVDGQPTSKHFDRLVYDDVVTEKSVTTPEMMRKTTDALALSYNLGAREGRRRFIGTRYHYNDTYKTIIDRRTVNERIYPATVNGEVEGEPVLLTREQLAEKRRDMGPYIFGCQMLQDPKADETQGFKTEWIKTYELSQTLSGMNQYILVDPASEKKKTNDYTSIMVVGLNADQNHYVVDMIRDRLNLTQRGDAVFSLHRKWQPLQVGYEKYGMMADIEYLNDRMGRENYRFDITELGGQQPKNDRIKRLIPDFEQGRIWFPTRCMKTNYEGETLDLTNAFVEEEYKPFPVGLHDDMLDALSRIKDEEMDLVWPQAYQKPERYGPKRRGAKYRSWMAA